jgi:acetyltransferase-like isoleucine patch superfamily enzyme
MSANYILQTEHVGSNVKIGEYAIIRPGVVLGDNVTVHPYVIIESNVVIGRGTEIYPGSFLGKQPKGVGSIARPIKYDDKVEIGEACVIGPYVVLYYDLKIGMNTLVGDSASIRENCQIGSDCVVGRHVTINYATKIGNRVKIMDHTWLSGNMVVEDGVFISGGVLTANDRDMGTAGYQEKEIIGPTIKARARIGVGAILLPGITVGEDAVVGAGAVVTKDVHPNETVIGIPAHPRNS